MARDDFWRLEHAFSDGPDTATVLDGHIGPEVPTANGTGYTLVVWETGASDSPTGEWSAAPERWQTLRRVGGPASATVVHETMGDGPKPYSVVGETAGDGGGLVTLYPPATSQYGYGGHFACTSVEDGTALPENLAVLEMELTLLASLDAYADRAAARDALEAPGI